MGFLFSLIANLLINRFFLAWAEQETSAAIGRMQDAAFDTPGAQSPLPAPVLVGGGALIAGELLLARWIGRLSGGRAVLALLLGGVVAGAFHWLGKSERS